MKKLFLILASLLSWTLAVQAENVTGERAAEAASAFFRSAQTKGMKVASAVSLKMVMSSSAFSSSQSSDDPAFYVFNNTSGPGFVIIAGDDAVRPVLGYSFENNFPEGRTLPPNLSAWLEGTARGVGMVRKSGVRPAKSASEAWEAAAPGTPVRKLETAKWDQDDPYYRLCPEMYGNLSVTGCTATALAIVMRYHKWPKRGTGELPGYYTYSYHFWVDGVKLGHTYDWDNMPLRYYDDYGNPTFTDAEAEAVAVLMRDCGILMESDYSPYSTGALTDDIPGPLVENMGYDSGLQYVFKNRYRASEWVDLMKNEIDSDRPILYGGYTTDWAGHSFVLDGYDSQDYFSVNWGWGGMSDGYFDIDILDPYEQGLGGADEGFSVAQDAIINIMPSKDAPLDENTSVTYNRPEDRITVKTLTGVEVALTDSKGTVLAEAVAEAGEASFNISDYEDRVFVLRVDNGRQSIEVTLEF